jgi:regulator of protease activity HflC (stomatin/prohibitin superfamily)
VSGCIYIQFVDAEKAAYGNSNPIYSVMQFAQSTMRAAIGEMQLDEILHARAELNTIIRRAVQEGAEPWGLKVLRYEITGVTPDKPIREAMDKQAAAERTRREKVLGAEGSKQEKELESQGYKVRLTNESEGDLIKVENASKASKLKQVLEAEGEAEAIRTRARANADAIRIMAQAMSEPGGAEAATLALAKEYVAMYGAMGAASNTLMLQERPADLNSLLAQATTVLSNAALVSKAPAASLQK